MEFIVQYFIQNLGSIVGLAILLGILAVLNTLKKDMATRFLQFMKDIGGKQHRSGMVASIRCDKQIYKELTRLMINVKASRAGVYQFHNGSNFSTNNPIWKISNTHEVCENGISSEIAEFQDMKASLLTPIISSLMDGDATAGIQRIEPCACERELKKCTRHGGILRVSPDQITHTYVHSLLLQRNVKFGLMAPIINKDSNIVGYMFIEFCGDGYKDANELLDDAKMICEISGLISFLLVSLDESVEIT